jgi:hypothetical protein
MYQIPAKATQRWSTTSSDNKIFVPRSIKIGCPFCGESPVIFSMTNQWEKRNDSLFKLAICPSCGEQSSFWMINFTGYPNEIDAQNKCTIFMHPTPPLAQKYDSEIDNLSPRFSDIYKQAARAEADGLTELVGIGYRKSLEILIKDWLIHENPADKDKISGQNISKCINEYVEDANLKECAKRAIWLANDETHYIRKWKDKDISDLKKLLNISLYWLSAHLASKRLIEDMPE